jgi:precorrin-2 dehydrogenase / sirohydrochlorin ferrochelatase
MKTYYPIYLDLADKPVTVIGAGKVGMRKIRGLLDAGARVTVVSPGAAGDLAGTTWIQREYQRGDLAGAFLAYAATEVRPVNLAVTEEARELGIPVNVADAPDDCGFIVPARLQIDDLQIAVSTGGTKPGRAAAIRDKIREFLSNLHL